MIIKVIEKIVSLISKKPKSNQEKFAGPVGPLEVIWNKDKYKKDF